MSGVCPTTPARTRNTFDDTPPIKDQVNLPVPDAAFNECAGGTNTDETIAPRPNGSVTEIEVCCPSPGPAGPEGPTGPTGADGVGIPAGGTVGQHLTKIDGTDYNTEWTDPAYGTGNVTWRSAWIAGLNYVVDDFVTLDGTSFICTNDHLSDDFNKPNYEFDYEGGTDWIAVSLGFLPEEKGAIDEAMDSLWDWVSDIENWNYEDYIGAVLGLGMVWAGATVLDEFYSADTDENSNYNGTDAYSGAYIAPLLPDVVSSLCDWAGITSYDVSALPNTDVSLKINALTSARTVLAMLSQVHFFDMVDSEGVLKFIPRAGQTSVRILTEKDDLGWSTSGTGTAPIAIKRVQGIDLPKRIELEYVSEANAYNKYVQTASLQTFGDGKVTKINLPITLEDDEAFTIAESIIINSHIERTTYAFSTSYKHIDLEPSDVITLENIGDVRILRIDEDKENGLLNFVAVDASFNTETYTSSGLAAMAPTYTDVPIIIGKSSGLSVELPPLDASDTEQRITLFPHGYGRAGWPGCAVYLSTDGGVSYSKYTDTYVESTWGKANVIVPSISNWYVWDETSTLTVELKTGTLSSVTDIEVMNGTNWCLIGEEVIGFKTATLIAANTYELTGLLRGRRGTEQFIGTHVADEAFILLDNAGVEFPYPQDAKEKVYYFKYVTIGTQLSSATAYAAQPSQKSRKPWQVANLDGNKVSNDFAFTWIVRNMFNGEMTDGGPVQLPDGDRGYGGVVIQMLDAGNADAPVRTAYVLVTDWTYTEAMQIADFGSIQGNVKLRIAQIDRLMGPGYEIIEVF